MASVLITNLATVPTHIGDLYKTLAAGESVTITRTPAQITSMSSLQAAIVAGTVSAVVTASADELGSGLAQMPNSIGADDMAQVASTDVAAGIISLRKALVAGIGGAADDVVMYAANTLPYKIRILTAEAHISTSPGASNVTLYDQAAGAGTVLGTFNSGTTGIKPSTAPTSSVVVTPGALIGIFCRRSDNTIAGEVVLTARRES